MSLHLTMTEVSEELRKIGVSIGRVSGTEEYRVAPMRGTKEEREMKAFYTLSLDNALLAGREMANESVSGSASLPCGITVEDARALSTEPATTTEPSDFPYGRYQIKCVTTGKIGRITYPTKDEAQEWADIHASELGVECEVIPYEPRDFAETPREALVAFARKMAGFTLSSEVPPESMEGAALEESLQAFESMIAKARALASMPKR